VDKLYYGYINKKNKDDPIQLFWIATLLTRDFTFLTMTSSKTKWPTAA